MNKQRLVLTGFMGTGKTTLARLIAEKTGLPAVDLDEWIVERARLSIPEIFSQMGEAGFRAWEAAACAEIGQHEKPMVIATGGGALLRAENRDALAEKSTIICLSARPEVIFERLKNVDDRPLLAGNNRSATIAALLEERHPLYSQFRWQLDTSDLTLDEAAQKIIDIWQYDADIRRYEQRIQSPEGSYPLHLAGGLLDNINDLLDVYGLAGRRTMVVTDNNVRTLHADELVARLPNAALVSMAPGESYKHLDTVGQFYSDFVREGLDRNGLVIALGGGVVGDTAGLAAATYMRGVRLVQIPTSLLAMVDSSVGAKVGVDIVMGKNLVGAFKQSELVLIDPNVLRTLPDEEYRAGMAEVLKAGLIAQPKLLEEGLPVEELIQMALQVKIDIVQRDPYEQGERAHLNLGHTFGHAIERVSGYQIRHGYAVAIGLVGAAMLSRQLGFLDDETVSLVERVVHRAGLPTRYQRMRAESIWDAMSSDKKWRDGRSHFVILRSIGQPDVVRDVPREMVMQVLEALHES
jgi:3-dehydroquinate synthase